MAQRAGKFKPFAIRQALFFLLAVLILQGASADAATTVEFPLFRLNDRWIESPFPSWVPARLQSIPEDDRTAVETILLEAAGDGTASMIAVGEAIRNRMGLFQKSAAEVCLQPKQFSGWNDRARSADFLREHHAYYGRAWVAWKLSSATRLTGGATDYHTQDISPYWAAVYFRTAQVGSHIFYIRQARRIRA